MLLHALQKDISTMSSNGPPPAWLAVKPYLNGGLSGMAATCIIQPIDMVKVRIQLGAKGSPVSTREGLHALHAAMAAGAVAQAADCSS